MLAQRTPTKLRSIPESATDRVAQLKGWETEAREWAMTRIQQAVLAAPSPMTAADLLAALDELAAPPGYELMRSNYAQRYHFIRRLLLALVKSNALETVPAINSRKRACSAFQAVSVRTEAPARRRRLRSSAQDYAVVVEGSPEWKGKLEEFLTANAKEMGSLDAILITRK